MSCGCIPVVSDIPPFYATTNNGALGFLFKAGNEAAIIEQLHKTQTAPVAALRKAIIAYAANHFSCNAVAEKFLSIAQDLRMQQQLQ